MARKPRDTVVGAEPPSASASAKTVFRVPAWAKGAWTIPYLLGLVLWRDRVPDGLSNDAAEEALRGLYLVGEHKFEVITFVIGNSAETLYLYLVGLVATFLGPITLAVQLPSWAFALGTISLFCLAATRLHASSPFWLPLLVGTSSVWLFHYARSGLRAIASPLFFLSFWLLLERADRPGSSRWSPLAAGVVLGLSVYAYTSCRVLVIAFLVYATLRCVLERQARSALFTRYGTVLVGFLLVSIPNLQFLLHHPHDFLFRGAYSVRRDIPTIALGLFWSYLFPFYYPFHLASTFDTDDVSNGLTVAGISPLHIIVAMALLAGLVQARRVWRTPGVLFLLVAWLTGTALIGIGGPSLTRFLLLLPVYLLFANFGLVEALRRRPRARLLLAVLLLLVLGTHAHRYFHEVEHSLRTKYDGISSATHMGKRAAALLAQRHRVVCVVSRDASVIRYLTHLHASNVRIVEFFVRPLVVEEIPLAEFTPGILLMERTPAFAAFSATLRDHPRIENEWFVEIDLRQSR